MAIQQQQPRPFETVLAVVVLSSIAASVISFVTILVAAGNGLQRADFAQGFWPVVVWVSYVGLPLGLVLMLVLLVLSIRRRSRENTTS